MRKPIKEYLKESNRANERKKLAYELKKYEHFLSKEMMEYLRSLLNLEISAVSSEASKREKELLSSFDIYDSVLEYNLKYRILTLLKYFDCFVGKTRMENCNMGTGVFFTYEGEFWPVYVFGKSQNWANQYVEIHKLISDRKFLEEEFENIQKIIRDGSDDFAHEIYRDQLKILLEADFEKEPFRSSSQFYDFIMKDFKLKRKDFGEELMDFCFGENCTTKKELEYPLLEMAHIEFNDVVAWIGKEKHHALEKEKEKSLKKVLGQR